MNDKYKRIKEEYERIKQEYIKWTIIWFVS